MKDKNWCKFCRKIKKYVIDNFCAECRSQFTRVAKEEKHYVGAKKPE
jgi:Zn finger protein HypA/HybF involved in hydrogenase expression